MPNPNFSGYDPSLPTGRCTRAIRVPLRTGIPGHFCPPLSSNREHERGPNPRDFADPGLRPSFQPGRFKKLLEVPVLVTTRVIPRILGSCGVAVPPACHCEMGLVSSSQKRSMGHFNTILHHRKRTADGPAHRLIPNQRSIARSGSENHTCRIGESSLLGFGEAFLTLNVVGMLTELPKMRACCFGSDGSRLSTDSEI